MSESERRCSAELNLADNALPIPIQIFLWKQVSPFVRPKLGKLHEASCMFCQHAMTGHHELKEACKSFERVLVQNIRSGLKPDLVEAMKLIPRWRLIQASLPHVMHAVASILYNRMKDGNIQSLGAVETKLLYTLHWIILDAVDECSDEDFEMGVFHSSPFYYLFSIPTITLFVYLFAPICHNLKESDFQNFRLENGLKIWQAMWEFRHPDAPCFASHCKPKPKLLDGKLPKVKAQFGDVFLGPLLSLFLMDPHQVNCDSLADIIKTVFEEDKTICYIHSKNDNFVLEKSLAVAGKAVLNYQMAYLHQTTSDIFCNGYILNLNDVAEFENYFHNRTKYSFYFKPHRRLLLFSNNSVKVTATLELISNLYGLDIITATRASGRIIFYSVYRNQTLLAWNYADISTLTLNKAKFKRFNWSPNFYIKNKRYPFRVSLFNCPPFVTLSRNGTEVGGTEHVIIETIAKTWPVEYKILTSPVKGMWSMVWKEMEDNSSDVAACSMWLSASTGKSVDFTYPFRQTCVTFLVPKPQLLPDSTFPFQPLQVEVWVLDTVVIFVATAFLYFIRSFYEDKVDVVEVYLHLIRLGSVGAIKQFPSLKQLPVRFSVLAWIWAVVILSTYYQAGLTSNLTKPRYANDVRTLKDMAERKLIWLAPTSYFQKNFLSSGSTTFATLAESYVKGDVEDLTPNKALTVKTLENVFVCDIENLDEEKRKPLKVLGECFGRYYYAFVLQKNSPFTQIFDRYSYMFSEHGLLKYWYRISLKEIRAQEVLFRAYTREGGATMDLAKMQGAFYLLVVVYVASAVVFLMEISFYKYYCICKFGLKIK
ncbi:hypothetical protein NQ315_012653 [Exocentrus adspersus]|uniref:Uncharacterized protein n=1 Tax=Exocentrus adspersus TaxID=1586481 RepID=A0AAV8VS10_9CUCU|nr:hypothetical protein NQ315_012653 [Exocentrus adspersus]